MKLVITLIVPFFLGVGNVGDRVANSEEYREPVSVMGMQ
jgi:hypothetical protein